MSGKKPRVSYWNIKQETERIGLARFRIRIWKLIAIRNEVDKGGRPYPSAVLKQDELAFIKTIDRAEVLLRRKTP